jgi:hypothetical protein
MPFLIEISTVQHSSSMFTVLTLVGVVGFIAAVTIGSIAWYNSKKPLGWKDEQRPDFLPKIDKQNSD